MAQKNDLVGLGMSPEIASAVGMSVQTVAAAGSAITDATLISQKLVNVTGADGTKGVKLPAGKPGDIFIIYNVANANLKLYPNTASMAINGDTAGAAKTVAAYETAILFQLDATNYKGGVAVQF